MYINQCKALMSFVRYGDAKLLKFVKAALAAISASGSFSSIDVVVAECQAIFDDYAKALEHAEKRPRSMPFARGNRRDRRLQRMQFLRARLSPHREAP